MTDKPRIFYGWLVAAACFFIELVAMGLANGTSSLYLKTICDDMNFSRGAYSFLYSIASLMHVISAVFFFRIQKKIGGVKRIILIGVICIIGSFFIYSIASCIALFYFGGALIGLGLALTATMPMSILISNWFVEKRGAAMGFVFSGSGIGSALMNPIVGGWIQHYGWRKSYVFSMIVMAVVSTPALLIIKGDPADKGMRPLGDNDIRMTNQTGSVNGQYLGKAQSRFLISMAAVFLIGMSVHPLYVNASACLAGFGISPLKIATVVSVIFMANTTAKVLLGTLIDKNGLKIVLIINGAAFSVAAILLMTLHNNFSVFAFAVAFGVSYTINTITVPSIPIILFGRDHYTHFIGKYSAALAAGYMLGVPLGGFSYDLFHSYSYAFAIQVLLCTCGVAILVVLTAKASSFEK